MISASLLLFAMATGVQAGVQGSAFVNPSFELTNANGNPRSWRPQTWGGQGRYTIVAGGRTGGKCALVESENGVDGGWQTTANVKPFSTYRLTAWIKTEGMTALTGQGALINLHGRPEHTAAITGTKDWTQVEMTVETGADDGLQVNCLVGYYGTAKGKAWFDDLSLELLKTKEMKPEATIDLSKTSEPISKYIYGQFIEHLGRCIYGGIWAEMLQDRKFFYPVGVSNSPWHVAEGGKVSSAKLDSFPGESYPTLEERTQIVQSGLGLVKGRKYVGYAWLAGTGKAKVTPGSARSFSYRLSEDLKKLTFSFTAAENVDRAQFRVEAESGRVTVGPVSLMPADNVRGMRKDTLRLLKDLDSPIYRWPGGNFVSGYDWRDGLGDRDKRPTRKNPAWQGIDTNDFGLHEFIDFCRLIKTEPEVVVNTGLGKLEWATDELAYCNAPASTPMGKQRAANGHTEPFKVKWWGIGNEMYGNWQLGNVPLTEYTKRHNAFVEAMRKVDPKIQVIAVGENYGAWTRGMFENCAPNIDLISEHFYCGERPSVYGHIGQIAEQIRNKAKNHRELLRTIPAAKAKGIEIAMDEWNYWYGPHVFGELGTRYFWKDGLGIAKGLHEFFRNSDIMFMAMYAQTVNVIGAIKTTQTAAEMETTGLVLQLYRQHFGTIPVQVGGAPEPLDVSAAFTSDRKALTIAVVNPMPEAITFPLTLTGLEGRRDEGTQGQGRPPTLDPRPSALLPGKAWTITNKDLMAFNDPGKPRKVDIVEKAAAVPKGTLRVEGYSVTLLRFSVK